MADLTDFELRLFEWIRQSDFETVAWSSKSAAKSFKCKENEIYDGVASLTKKLPNRFKFTMKMAMYTSLLNKHDLRRLTYRWSLCTMHQDWQIYF